MEHYKISEVLNDSTVSRFVTKKSIEISDLSSGQYSAIKNIGFKTSMLKTDLCDFSDVVTIVKGRINVKGNNPNNHENKKLTYKNNAPFRSWIEKINNTLVDSAEDLGIVMPMYNSLEYSDNYSMTSGSLWNYHRHQVNDNASENNADNYRINKNKIITSKSFKYKTKIMGSTSYDNNALDAEVVISLNYLSNFWRSLDLP